MRRRPADAHGDVLRNVLRALHEVQFQNPLEMLWCSLKEVICNKVGIYLTQSWAIASLQMPVIAIKVCSHSGACVRWNRIANCPSGRWRWYDAGNWVYAVIWFAIRKTSRHLSRHARSDQQRARARRLLHAMSLASTRWSRIAHGGPKAWELCGDLVELALGRGYYSKELECIVMAISEFACYIAEIYAVLMTNAPPGYAPPRICPEDFASLLLTARSGHFTGQWHDFEDLLHCAQVDV